VWPYVAVPVAVLCLILIAVLLWRKRRRSGRPPSGSAEELATEARTGGGADR
jgi:uncharacterized iron-regulated membrane protein